jgi:hypothetical protein
MDALLRPLPTPQLLPLAAVVLVAGAAYCLGYEGLRGGVGHWPGSLLWSACAVLPWLVLFEGVKRREAALEAPLSPRLLAILLVATGIASVGLEYGVDWIREARSAPLGLQLLRRLPAIAASLLLILLARRHYSVARRDSAGEAETLRRHAASIRWIRAADNYLELHLDRRILTLRMTMRDAADLLEPLGFVRTHRSFIVARRRIESLDRDRIRLDDGTDLPLGRAFAPGLATTG